MNPTEKAPELLAPAGGLAQLDAAIHAGADAVYFGLDRGLNARVRAEGIPWDELESVMQRLHEHGLRGYLTLNTLVFDEELAQAERHIRHAARCGVDALIVQDTGIVRLAQATAPNLPLHGSTQMSITDSMGVAFARSLGIKRVVLGRELSIDDLASIYGENTGIEIEAFVHGALCVSYSGQCYSSEAWGGRSANRGQCAQACRLPYGLVVDGSIRQQGDLNYLLSPQDLMGLPWLPRLVRAGVRSLKIEGRLKGPAYVAATVRAYREALDQAMKGVAQNPSLSEIPVEIGTRRTLAQLFSRGQDAANDGLSPGFLLGPRHQELVIGRNPRHRGLHLGTVDKIFEDGIRLDLHNPVKPGDGVVFDSGDPQQKEPGGNVFHIERDGNRIRKELAEGGVTLRFGRGFRADSIHVGDHVWRTRDSATDGGPRLHDRETLGRLPIALRLCGDLGSPLQIELSDRRGRRAQASSEASLQAATRRALDDDSLRQAIGQLGDTPFAIADFENAVAPGLFLPVGEIKKARRRAVAELIPILHQHQRDLGMPAQAVLPGLLPATAHRQVTTRPALSLLCRTAEQVEAALQLDCVSEIILDFLEVHGLKQACTRVRATGHRLAIAAPRIFKPGEERLVRYLLHLRPDALLVRSAGLLWQLNRHGGSGAIYEGETRIPELWGDFSLNAANRLATATLLDLGLNRLAPTHDLNAAQIGALASGLPQAYRDRIEVIAHHHLPIFHTEHCVFARFLSRGNSYRDCGRPCEAHIVHLRDSKGHDHLVQADIGCRNTVFNAAAQSAAATMKPLTNAGIGHYRIELIDEPASQVADIVNGYRDLLDGRLDHKALWEMLAKVTDTNGNPQGVESGAFADRSELPRAQMKKPTAR